MFDNGNSVVSGNRKWKVVRELRDEDTEEYQHAGVRGFYFKDLGKVNRIYLVNSTHNLWDIKFF